MSKKSEKAKNRQKKRQQRGKKTQKRKGKASSQEGQSHQSQFGGFVDLNDDALLAALMSANFDSGIPHELTMTMMDEVMGDLLDSDPMEMLEALSSMHDDLGELHLDELMEALFAPMLNTLQVKAREVSKTEAQIRANRNLNTVPTLVDGNTVRYEPEQAEMFLGNLDSISGVGSESAAAELRAEYTQVLLGGFVHLKDPQTESASVSSDIRKHFLMVSPDGSPFPHPPNQVLEKRANWEALRRAIIHSGADLTVQDSMDPKSIQYFSCRDSFVSVNNTAYVPVSDQIIQHSLSEISGGMYGGRMGDHARIEDFLTKQGQRVVTMQGSGLDGGNVIVHPQSGTVFVGVGKLEEGLPFYLDDERLLQATLDHHETQKWTVVPITLVEMDTDPFEAVHFMNQTGMSTTPFYHLDMGMTEPLLNGEVLIYPEMCTSENFEEISGRVGRDNIIEMTRDEGSVCSANMISNGANIIVSEPSHRLRTLFKHRGMPVISAAEFGVKSFEVGDANAHCLTNIVRQPMALRQ